MHHEQRGAPAGAIPGWRSSIITAVFAVAISLASSAPIAAQEKGGAAAATGEEASAASAVPERVAVVDLGPGLRARRLTGQIGSVLGDSGYEVSDPEAMRSAIDEAMITLEDIPPSVQAQFAGFKQQVGEGTKMFFYMGTEPAIEKLDPVFNLATDNPAFLSFHSDLAVLTHDAGVLLLRGYQETGEKEEADEIAKFLVTLFPSYIPSQETAPPSVTERLEAERDRMRQSGTTMEIAKFGQQQHCRFSLNGLSIDAGVTYGVKPNLSYYVRIVCPNQPKMTWRLDPTKGRHHRVVATTTHPMDYRMSEEGGGTTSEAALHLSAIRFWTDADASMGVIAENHPSTPYRLVYVHDTVEKRDGTEAVGEVLDEFLPLTEEARRATVRLQQDGSSGSGGSLDVLGWSLTGGGVLTAGLGAFLIMRSSAVSQRIRCSPNVDDDKSGCGDVPDPYVFDSGEELVARRSQRNWLTIGGVTASAIGVGLVGWGIYELVTDAPDADRPATGSAPEDRARLDVRVGPAGAYVGVRWRF